MPDLKFALRRLRSTPIFTTFAIVTLALGIGATTAIYSMVRLVLAPPPGVANLDRVVVVSPSEHFRSEVSVPDFQDLRARQKGLERVTAWTFFGTPLTANGQSMTTFGEIVDGDYFQVLGVKPARGRLLQPGDDRVTAAPVAVISDTVWHRLFARDDGVLGRDIRISGERFEIVGVAPPEFHGLFNNGLMPGSVWVPLESAKSLARVGSRFRSTGRDDRWLSVRGLLPPGRSVDDVAAEIGGIGRQLEAEHPTPRESGRPRQWSASLMADANLLQGSAWLVHGLVAAVMTAVGAVLLIACSNLANLMLARGSERRAEMAVRLALGASRTRLVRATLIDSGLLALAGGLGGLAVARFIVVSISGEMGIVGTAATILFEPRLDAAAFAMAAAATILTLVIIGLAPALQLTRADVRSALVGAGSGGVLRWRGRRALISAQVMASVVLLSIAALAHSQLRQTRTGDSGLDLEHLAIATVDFKDQRYEDVRAIQIAEAVVGALGRHPDIAHAAVSTGLPVGEGVVAWQHRLRAGTDAPPRITTVVAGTPGVLETLGVRLVHGRVWTGTDSPNVVVVDQSTAQAFFGTDQAAGRTIDLEQLTNSDGRRIMGRLTVIGVAADTDTRYAGHRDRLRGAAYMPLDLRLGSSLVFTARAHTDPAQVVSVIRQTIAAVDRDLAVRLTGTGLTLAGLNNQFYSIAGGITGLLGSFASVPRARRPLRRALERRRSPHA